MEYTAVLMQLLTLITAIVMLKKHVLETQSAQIKLDTEKAKSPTPTQSSAFIQRTSPRSFRVLSGCIIALSAGAIGLMALGPDSVDPASRRDTALAGLCVANVVLASGLL